MELAILSAPTAGDLAEVTDPDTDADASDGATSGWPRWSRRLTVHALALLFALSLLLALGGPRTAISSDEGAGIRQAILLQRGGWLIGPTLPELDPSLVQQPFLRADAGPKGRAPYAKHPAYPVLLEWAAGWWWPHGLVLPGLVGAWVAALASALLARALSPRATLPTLWLLGLGSPLAVDAQLVLAHAPAAGTAAVATLAAAVVLAPSAFGRRAAHRWAPSLATLAAAAAAATTVALRSEGALLVGGLVVGVLLSGSDRRRSIPLAAILMAAVAGVRGAETAVVRSVVGRTGGALVAPSQGHTSFLHGRIQAFQASWADVSTDGHPGGLLLGIGVCALLLAVVGVRRRAGRTTVVALVVVAVGGALSWLLVGDVGLVPGLLPATPWLVAGLAAIRFPVLRAPGIPRFLAAASASAAAAILITQYSFGGGVEWGGRFYAIVLPVVAPLAVSALWPSSPGWRRAPGALVVAGTVAVTALVALGGLLVVRSSHDETAALAHEVAAAAQAAPPGRPGDPDGRSVVVGPQRLWPQLLWPDFDAHRWVAADRAQLPCSLYGLQASGFGRLVLLGPFPDDLVGLAEAEGWRRVEASTGRFTRVVESQPTRPGGPPSCPPGLAG